MRKCTHCNSTGFIPTSATGIRDCPKCKGIGETGKVKGRMKKKHAILRKQKI
jgi:DnaJ-class molecular chaperone